MKILQKAQNIISRYILLAALFSSEDKDEDVRKLNQTFVGLLGKYFKSYLSEEYEMQHIGTVLKTLPHLSKCVGQS